MGVNYNLDWYFGLEIERGDETERGDEIERRCGLGHGERNRDRGRTVNTASIGHRTLFFFSPPFFRFGYEMLLLIEFFFFG